MPGAPGSLVRPAVVAPTGFESATRCLEDAAQLSDVFSYLGK